MAFDIVRTQKTLPGRASAVRANIDVDTGGQMMAQAVSDLGRAISKEGLRRDLIEADTQLSEFQRKSREEIYRLGNSFRDNLDPATYQAEFENSLKIINSYLPQNKRAARAAGLWLNSRIPEWQQGVEDSRFQRIDDNFEAEGWKLRQEGIETNDLTKFRLHLWKGKKLGVYTAEQSEVYLQSAVEDAKKFAAAEEARLKREYKEAMDEAQEQGAINLFVGILRGEITDPKDVTDALDFGIISFEDAKYLNNYLKSSKPAELDLQVYSDILARKNKYLTSPTKEEKKKLVSLIIRNISSLDKTRAIGLIEDIAAAEDPKAPLSTNRAQIYFGLLTEEYTESTGSLNGNPLMFDNKYTKLKNFFHTKPDATAKEASEFYEELMRDVADSWLEKVWEWNVRWRPYEIWKRRGSKETENPFPEYPDAFQLGDNWYIIGDGKNNTIKGKRYRIEE
jgi:hypothetical protein